MRALRSMDDPYPLHGAAVATRYCSPRNRASELSPEVFARYLEDPWYSILVEWDEMEEEDDDDDDDEGEERGSSTEVEVLVRRKGEEAFSMVSARRQSSRPCARSVLTVGTRLAMRHLVPDGI
jgi:hypothetical protein